MAKQFTLGKQERLKSRKAIEHLFKKGKRFSVDPFRIFYALKDEKGLQAGVTAGSKTFKKAVDRNRIKRLTREVWRLQKKELLEKISLQNKGLHIFFIYTGKELPEYKQLFDSMQIILKKLDALIEK